MNRTNPIKIVVAVLIAVSLLVVTTALAASGPGKGGSGGSSTDDETTEETTTGGTTTAGTTTVTVTVTTPVSPPPVAPPPASAKIARRPCGTRSRMTLTLRPSRRWIGVDVQVVARQRSEGRRAERWRLVVFHERRISRRTWAVAKPVTGWFQAKVSVANWEGVDAITTRAVSASGETCSVTLTV